MKTIHLIRHAKSDWDKPFQSDKERLLAKRGEKNAKELSKYISNQTEQIDIAFVSSSERTLETYNILSKENEIAKSIAILDEIYECDLNELLLFLSKVDEVYQSILIVGHNPGLEELANYLLTKNREGSLFCKFPTSTYMIIEIESDSWKEIDLHKGKLKLFWIPR